MTPLVCFLVLASQGVPVDKPVPEWSLSALAMLKKTGLLVGYPDSPHRRNTTRYDCAVAVHATKDYLHRDLEESARQLTSSDRSARVVAELDVKETKDWLPRVDDLLLLTTEFGPELRYLEVDTNAMSELLRKDRKLLIALPQRVKPFPDVPSGHWAADATNALKRAGLLVGYPSGKFGG